MTTPNTDPLAPDNFRGNWLKREDFSWDARAQPADSEEFGLYPLMHRDSGLTAKARAAVIKKSMKNFERYGHVTYESFTHFGFGWVEEIGVRVYRKGRSYKETTAAFEAFVAVIEVCDGDSEFDSAYARLSREYALEWIETGIPRAEQAELTRGWATKVYDWLTENKSDEMRNIDDAGPCPSRQLIGEALVALGMIPKLEVTCSTKLR